MGILPIPRTPLNPPRRGGLRKAQEGLVRLKINKTKKQWKRKTSA